MTEIVDFAAALRQMADNADQLADRHDVAEMAALRRQVDEQAAKARRDADLIAELRRQVTAAWRSLDAIGRMRKNVLALKESDAVQILAEALMVIDRDCDNYTGPSTCREDASRTRRAEFTADAWCDPCVARDALERAGAVVSS